MWKRSLIHFLILNIKIKNWLQTNLLNSLRLLNKYLYIYTSNLNYFLFINWLNKYKYLNKIIY